MKIPPTCFRTCHHLGWILGQTSKIVEVHSEGREHCGGCDWRPVKIKISNRSGCCTRAGRWAKHSSEIPSTSVFLWVHGTGKSDSHSCFFVNGSFPKRYRVKSRWEMAGCYLREFLPLSIWIADNSIYVHTWKRFCHKKLNEVTKSSQHSELQLLEGSLHDAGIQSQPSTQTFCRMRKNCFNHFFMHFFQHHKNLIHFKYGQGVNILGWLET